MLALLFDYTEEFSVELNDDLENATLKITTNKGTLTVTTDVIDYGLESTLNYTYTIN